MIDPNQQRLQLRGWKRWLTIVAFWSLLWATVPALYVWGTKPYIRQSLGSLGGKSHAELEAALNNRYAVDYLIFGALLGMVGGLIAVWLPQVWQVLLLSVTVGVCLVAVFNSRNAPPGFGMRENASSAIVNGGLDGIVVGVGLAVVHRRIGRSTSPRRPIG